MSQTIGEQLRQRAKEYTPQPQKRGLRDIVSEYYKDIKHARQQDLPWEEIAKVLGIKVSTSTLKKYFYEESSARKRWRKTRSQTVKSAPAASSEPGEQQTARPQTFAELTNESVGISGQRGLPKAGGPLARRAQQNHEAQDKPSPSPGLLRPSV